MTVILGFGSTEAGVRQSVMRDLAAGKDFRALQAEMNGAADCFDKLPREVAPERYTRIYLHTNALVFQHINRRHALSPDGWALLQVEHPWPSGRAAEGAA